MRLYKCQWQNQTLHKAVTTVSHTTFCIRAEWKQQLSPYKEEELPAYILQRIATFCIVWLTTGNRMRFGAICSNEEVVLQVGDITHTQLSWKSHEFCTARNSLSCGGWRRYQEPGAELLGVLCLNIHCHQLQLVKTIKQKKTRQLQAALEPLVQCWCK